MDGCGICDFRKVGGFFSELATRLSTYWLFCYEVEATSNLTGDWKKMKQANVSFIKNPL